MRPHWEAGKPYRETSDGKVILNSFHNCINVENKHASSIQSQGNDVKTPQGSTAGRAGGIEGSRRATHTTHHGA